MYDNLLSELPNFVAGISTKHWRSLGAADYAGEIKEGLSDIYVNWTKDWLGTAFIIYRKTECHPGKTILYIVTARHVIKEAPALCRYLYVRMTKSNGDACTLVTPRDDWQFHQDETIDIAVLPIAHDKNADYIKSLPLDYFLSDRSTIGIGTPIYMTGLFVKRPGIDRNLPTLLSGIISAMPGEPILTSLEKGLKAGIEAYLVNVYCTGGFSGSPVYVQVEGKPTNDPLNVESGLRKYYLLGLLHGHIDNEPTISALKGNIRKKKSFKQKLQMRNSTQHLFYLKGLPPLGIVVPAQNILDVLNQENIRTVVASLNISRFDDPAIEVLDTDNSDSETLVDLNEA